MSNKLLHTNTYEWFGEFFNNGNSEKRFPGKLTYTPSSGIELDVYLTTGMSDIIKSEDIIHGFVVELGKVSLIGLHYSNPYPFKSPINSSQFKIRVKSLLSGIHYVNEKIDKCCFSLNSTSDFCAPFGTEETAFHRSPILTAKTSEYKLQLHMSATATFIDNFVKSHLITDNDKFKKELSDKYQELKGRYPNAQTSLKKNIEYIFTAKSLRNTLEIKDAFNIINEVKAFFSFIQIKNINPVAIRLYINDTKVHTLKSLYLNTKSINDITSETRFNFYDVNINYIKNFSDTLNKWHTFFSDEMNLLHEVSHSRNNLSPSSIQHFLITIAGIEQHISRVFNTTHKCCDIFINEYATEALIKDIKLNIPPIKNGESIGKVIADIRNCIVHTNKMKSGGFKRFKDYINPINIGNLNEVLYGCILIAIFKELGFDEELQNMFKDNIKHHLLRHISI
ncbi:hypothetical protein ACRXCV_03265 [Halobacteriovorax sp. GFR7]|uniref:ApeA N-terminal domain 1-containing protein n=1 Tax=unclassified Halobacteriovorax TaxID=2639665 RepID=UPI003D953B0F